MGRIIVAKGQMSYNKETVLSGARAEAQRWLDALDVSGFTGDYNTTAIAKAMQGLTFKGKPVVCFCVQNPQEALMVCGLLEVLQRDTKQLDSQTKKQFRGLSYNPLYTQYKNQLWHQSKEQLGNWLYSHLWEQLQEQFNDQLSGQLNDFLYGQLWRQLKVQLKDQLKNQSSDQLWCQIFDQLRDQLRDHLGDQLWDHRRNLLRGQLKDRFSDQFWRRVRDRLWIQLHEKFDNQLSDQLKDLLKEQLRDLQPWYHIWDYYMMAFFESVSHQLVEEHQLEFVRHSSLPAFRKGLGWIVNLGSVVIGVARPEAHLDENRRIHKPDGPAIVWGNERKYFWHGVPVEKDWIESPASVDARLALTEPNIERRRALSEILGWERIWPHLKGEVIQSDSYGELVRTQSLDDGDSFALFVRVQCPTGRQYILRVPPTCKSAHEGVAATYGLTQEQYQLEVRT